MPQSYPATNVSGAEAEKAWFELFEAALCPSPAFSIV